MQKRTLAAFVIITIICFFHSQLHATSAEIRPSSGKELCSALTAAEFTKAGITFVSANNFNIDNDSSAYCSYNTNTGIVELDIFYPAGDTPDGVLATERTVWAEVGGKFEPITIPGADSAKINLAVPGKKPSASIAVRKNTAVFTINIPTNPNVKQELLTLSQTILNRLPSSSPSHK
ncbi:MAG: hypothetical protein JOZ80_05560 [Acidobacteriaceae bacterium]|nr:hypothetical protein [Acidobacteriaceae bacterium]